MSSTREHAWLPEMPDRIHNAGGPSQPAAPISYLPPLHPRFSGHSESNLQRHPPTGIAVSETGVLLDPLASNEPQSATSEKNTAGSSEERKDDDHDGDRGEPAEGEMVDLNGRAWWAVYLNALLILALAGICIYAITMGIIYYAGKAVEDERLFKLDEERRQHSGFLAITTTMHASIKTQDSPQIPSMLSERAGPDSTETDDDTTQPCGLTGQSCSSESHPELCCPAGLICKTFELGPPGVYCYSPSVNNAHGFVAPDDHIQTECPENMFRCEHEEGGGCCPDGTSCIHNRYVRVVNADAPGLEQRPMPPGFVRPDPSKRTLTVRKFAEVAPRQPTSSPASHFEGGPVVVPGLLPIGPPISSGGNDAALPSPSTDPITASETTPTVPNVPPSPATHSTSTIMSTPFVDSPSSNEVVSESTPKSTPGSASIDSQPITFQSSTTRRSEWHEFASPTPSLPSSSSRVALSGAGLMIVLLAFVMQ